MSVSRETVTTGEAAGRPLHVALVTQGPPGPNAGGTLIAGWSLLNWLREHGHHVTVVSLPLPWHDLPADQAALNRLGVPVVDLAASRRSSRSKLVTTVFGDAFPTGRLAAQVNAALVRLNPDVVVAQHYEGLAAIQRVARMPRMALLGDPERLVRYYRWRYSGSEGSFMRRIGLFMSWLNAWAQTPRLARMMRSCEALGATAAHHARWYARQAYRPCLYVPTPIVDSAGTDWRARRSPQGGQGRYTIIHLGNLGGTANRPGIERLLRVVVPILDRTLGPDRYELHFIGYPAGMPEQLRRIAQQRSNIKIRGFLSGILMEDAFRTADALVVPNPMRLGNRVRIGTAFAFGCPVVSHSANQAGMPELVHDRNVRFADTAEQLGEELLRVIHDPVLQHRLAEEGRRTYEQHYSANVVCERVGEELERIVGTASLRQHPGDWSTAAKHWVRRRLSPQTYGALQRVFYGFQRRWRSLMGFDLRAFACSLRAYRPRSLAIYGLDAAGWHLLQVLNDFLGPRAGERAAAWLRAGQRIAHRPLVTYAFKRHGIFVARPFTLDRIVLHEVLATNIYRERLQIREGDTVVDLGAHIGVFTVLAAAHGRGVRVYSYEPVAENVELLKHNVARNRVSDQVTICPAAVGGTRGRASFGVSAGGMGRLASSLNGLQYREVDTVTLEDVFVTHGLTRVHFLKVDVEAAEYDLFAALPKVYFNRIDRIAMECHLSTQPERFPRLMSLLEEVGFTLLIVPGARASLRFVFAQRAVPLPVNGSAREALAAACVSLSGAGSDV